jgi:hypothetical protein
MSTVVIPVKGMGGEKWEAKLILIRKHVSFERLIPKKRFH